MAMAAKSNEMAPKFNDQYSNTWEDYNEELNPEGSANSKLRNYNKKMKSAATTGFEKAKSAASTGAKKAKAGTSAGVRWMKIQYQKKTSHTSQYQQASEFN